MNNYLLVSIGLMFMLFVIAQAVEVSNVSLINEETYTFDETTGEPIIINGTSTEITFGEQNLVLGINLTEGIMITGIALGALITVIGVSVATYSLSDIAQKAIINFSIYGGIWGIFSVTTYNLLTLEPVLGWFLFFIVSFIHLSGIIKNINGNA